MTIDHDLKTGPWTVAEIKRVTELYPNHQNTVIAGMMGRSKRSIDQAAVRLNLHKSAEHNRKVKDHFYDLRHGLTAAQYGETSRPPRTIEFRPLQPKTLAPSVAERMAAFRSIPSYSFKHSGG